MTITVTGSTGFIGRHLLPMLRSRGHAVHNISGRSIATGGEPVLPQCGAVIHLAGETVAQRWTAEAKRKIRDSRVEGTRHLLAAMGKAAVPPMALLGASAVGIYGSRGDEVLDETSPPGSGFLADLTKQWEAEASAAEAIGIRVVSLRFSVVLGRDGGGFPKIARLFRFGVGGRLGSGTQWMPWIHIHDAAAMIVLALENTNVRGPLNVTAPQPVMNREFAVSLASALHRPAIFPVPEFALRLVLGEMAEAVLSSERVVPRAAAAAGFDYSFGDLGAALCDLTGH